MVLLLATVGPARAAGGPGPDAPPAPVTGHPWFGPVLDLGDDDPRSYAARLGTIPSLYGFAVDYPLDDDARGSLRRDLEAVATQGAVAVVDLEPQAPLADLTVADARALAAELEKVHRELDTYALVRFAPEMNGSWVTWGQQPLTYVQAFRAVADAVHARTDQAAMVWAPAYGAGYPFGAAYGAVDPSGVRDEDQLDTTRDGRVDERDDPYGPYYPGDEAVDWVGLSLYRFAGDVPTPGELESRLDETGGYGVPARRASFYDRFAAGRHQHLLLETAARADGAGAGSELEVKRGWWQQALAVLPDRPWIGAVSWLEVQRHEAEVDGRLVDWRATHTPTLARALHADLVDAGVDLGPVTRRLTQTVGNQATAQGRLPAAADLGRSMGWIVLCVLLLAVVLAVSGAVGRLVPSWGYADEAGTSRDLRIDLFRGFLICTVVITHTELAGPYSYLTLNAFGAVSGAEGFVMLSGVVLGMVQASQVRRIGEWPAAVLRLRRARKIYLVALVVTVLVYVLGLLPGLDATVVTTFTDRGTGAGGASAAGQVYDLYVNARHLLDYPPPWFAVRELLTLHMGPWVLNVLGLFVVLTVLVPVFSWLLVRGLWWLVLAISLAGYVYGSVSDVHWLPSQFEDVFPLLIWQLAFVGGLVLGFHRQRVVSALTGAPGKLLYGVAVAAYAGVLGWLWLVHRGVLPHGPWDADSYAWVYHHLYLRVDLQPGRVLDLALVAVVAFAFLTAFWRPVHGALGGFLVPLGQASLYVFIVHVFLVIAVANVPGLDRDSVWQGLVLHSVELAVVWALVRQRVLFSLIPR